MRRVVVHIDRLVLNGFSARDREGIAEGLRAELGRLLAEPTSGERLGAMPNVPKVDGGTVSVRRGGVASETGAALGGAVARALGSRLRLIPGQSGRGSNDE